MTPEAEKRLREQLEEAARLNWHHIRVSTDWVRTLLRELDELRTAPRIVSVPDDDDGIAW